MKSVTRRRGSPQSSTAGRIVTAAIDRMTFRHPVHVGELLTCRASVNAVWRTSMEVGVRVEAENPRTGDVRHTSTAYLTMVALDDDGRPTRVPPCTRVPRRGAANAGGGAAAAATGSPSAKDPRRRVGQRLAASAERAEHLHVVAAIALRPLSHTRRRCGCSCASACSRGGPCSSAHVWFGVGSRRRCSLPPRSSAACSRGRPGHPAPGPGVDVVEESLLEHRARVGAGGAGERAVRQQGAKCPPGALAVGAASDQPLGLYGGAAGCAAGHAGSMPPEGATPTAVSRRPAVSAKSSVRPMPPYSGAGVRPLAAVGRTSRLSDAVGTPGSTRKPAVKTRYSAGDVAGGTSSLRGCEPWRGVDLT